METVYQNEELLKLTFGSYYIHDAVVTRFDIYEHEYQLCVDVYFKSWERKLKTEKILKITFNGVIEYSFYHHKKYNFYNVESYKFYKLKQGYYISLDPADTTETKSEDDQDFILCESVEGCFIMPTLLPQV